MFIVLKPIKFMGSNIHCIEGVIEPVRFIENCFQLVVYSHWNLVSVMHVTAISIASLPQPISNWLHYPHLIFFYFFSFSFEQEVSDMSM